MTASAKRVLLIGLDGATFDLIEPWKAQLPNLTQLIATGGHGALASTLQPTTAPAWTTCLTGVNQGKHGLYDFVRRRSGSYHLEITNSSQIGAPTFFDIASQQGKQVVALNIPYTYPPRPVNGVMIGGPFAPTVTPELVYPVGYYETLRQLTPDYFILPDFDQRAENPLLDYHQKLLKAIAMREKLSLHLLKTEPWDLFMVVFMATDEVQHTFWHCMEAAEGTPEARHRHAIFAVYKRLDEMVGKLVAQARADGDERETVVFILSDHGAGAFRWMINLNQWLAQMGYLRFHSATQSVGGRVKTAVIKKLAHAYREYLPAQTRATIRQRLGIERFEAVKENFESSLLTSTVDWEQTQAYSLGAGGNIYINLQGREPNGIVAPDNAYDELCEAIRSHLLTLADPETGKPLVRAVHRREELYSGPFLPQAPELIIEWLDYADWGRGQYDAQAPVFERQRAFDFSTQPLTGSHRPHGILIANGSGICPGTHVEGAHLLDIAPTVLSLLGVPTPANFDGQLLRGLFEEEVAAQLDALIGHGEMALPDQSFDFSDEEQERIAEHLRALGYL
ncbi:MAG: alkaline phosphatase family protein [Anaerolineales bacterium]|nr:alkaline phosphatase family protein [Anaerolineales bacterium]